MSLFESLHFRYFNTFASLEALFGGLNEIMYIKYHIEF